MVVPVGARSISRTLVCLDDAGAAVFGGVGFLGEEDERVFKEDGGGRLITDGDFGAVFVLDFRLLVAIWLSLRERQHRVLPLPQARSIAGSVLAPERWLIFGCEQMPLDGQRCTK